MRPRARQGGAAASGSGGVAELIAQSQALASLNKAVEGRDFWANIARDIARADLHLKPSEFLAIWAGSIVGIPSLMVFLSVFLPALRQPAVPADRDRDRVLPASALARPPAKRSPGRVQQAAPGHDHLDRERPARRFVVPPGDRAGRSRDATARSRSSSRGSSGRSTWACPSSRRSRTWFAAFARMTSS